MSDVITELANEVNDKTMQIARLKADNDRLRNDVAETALMLGAAWERCSKLREFIDLKETCWKYIGWCDECPYNGVDDEHDDCNCTVREKVNSLARELGVEVDA